MSFEIEARGLDEAAAYTRGLGSKIARALVYSVNDAALFGRRLTSREIRNRLNFKVKDLTGGDTPKLRISKYAKEADVEAIVSGQDRPTSLASFRVGQATFGRGRRPPRVKVGRGGGNEQMDRAFYVRLRRGAAAVTAENSNIGLAIRLRPGEQVSNKTNTVKFGGGLTLLYGPSVGQAMRTLLPEEIDEIGAYQVDRFVHHLQRL